MSNLPKISIMLAQIEVIPGRPDLNFSKIKEYVNIAKSKKMHIVAFPEMCVGGYMLGDNLLSDDYCRMLMSYNENICELSKDIGIIFGNIYVETNNIGKGYHPNKDGRSRKYNAIYAFHNGSAVQKKKEFDFIPKGIQPKILLPNYRVFDDERYFFSLNLVAQDYNIPIEDLIQPYTFNFKDVGEVSVGTEVCEDLWCNDYRKNGEALNPTKILIKNGAELIINISCSPWTFGKNGARDRRVEFLKKECNHTMVPFYYVNNTGCQNNGKNFITFDGGTTVYNQDGKPILFSTEAYEEEAILVHPEIFNENSKIRIEVPKIIQKFKAITCGLKHLKNIIGKDGPWIIGISGGIDSALVASLCAYVSGPENVMAVNLPTIYNAEKTKNAAKNIADNLGIKYLVVPIQDLVEVNNKTIEDANFDGIKKELSVLNYENIQAKIRGTCILSNLAAKYGGIFTNNGNKVEIALGYATLYGDVGGAIAPIGDLTKKETYELARYINEVFGKQVIPEILFPDDLFRFSEGKIIPSAELKDNQIDPMKFGYHCALISEITNYQKKSIEEICRWYIEGTMETNLGISHDLLVRWNIQDPKIFIEDLEWVFKMQQISIFKRIQAPPIIVTSKSAYGYDIRESQLPFIFSPEYLKLKAEILTKIIEYKQKI